MSFDEKELEAYYRARIKRALSLTLFWLNRGADGEGDSSNAWAKRRGALLAKTVFGDLPEGELPWPINDQEDHPCPWRGWIALRGIQARAESEGGRSLAARWLNSLPGYQSGHLPSEQTREQHAYAHMALAPALGVAWTLAGVYSQESFELADFCETIVMRAPLAPEKGAPCWELDSLMAQLKESIGAHREKELLGNIISVGFNARAALRV